MIIKSFKNFKLYLESSNYEYGCLMLNLGIPNWSELTSKIDPDDLYQSDNERYGMETEPHCTILYGIHDDVKDEQVESIVKGFNFGNLNLDIDGIGCFYNKDYDVLKLNVVSDELHRMNDMTKSLPNTNYYPDYKPHITLGYLNKGSGQKYVDPTFITKLDKLNKIVYSKPNGEKIDFPITNNS